MGKSWKSRPHLSTGYPYSPIRAAHLQVLRPKIREEDEERLLMGMYAQTSGHPLFSNTNLQKNSSSLKHLEFVRVYSQHYYDKAARVYKGGCSFLPASCRAGLNTIEARVNNFSAPLLNGLQEGSERVLWTLDSKVDSLVRAAQSLHSYSPVANARVGHALVVAEASEARQDYLRMIEETLSFVREKGISGTAKHTINVLLKRLEEAQNLPSHLEADAMPLIANVGEAWTKLAAFPPVHKILEKAQPSVQYTQRKYMDAHDAIVASAMYSRALETTADILQRVQVSTFYKVAAERLYPAISGIADPALEKIANSSYTRAVVEHLKPVPQPAEMEWPALSCMPC